jgi:hypothetical protein
MPSSGGGTGTPIPIVPGVPADINVQPLLRTQLPLARYAKIIGINPVHFSGADGATYFPVTGSCGQIWPRHTWQATEEIVSHEELTQAILWAEDDIKHVLGFSTSPVWEYQEVHRWTQPYDALLVNNGGYAADAKKQTVSARYGKIISPGRRSVELINSGSTVTYSDQDGDGWNETATVTATTTVTEPCEVKLFHTGTLGDTRWEIRPLRSVSISGGTATIVLDAWLLFDPNLHGAYPTTVDFSAMDAEDSASYVATVDVYREYNDLTQATAEFLWEKNPGATGNIFTCTVCSGTGCEVCSQATQDGCFSVRDGNSGIVTPFPASYDADNDIWTATNFSECRTPDQVRLYYRAGLSDQQYLSGLYCDPLEHRMAEAIAFLATARLNRPLCECSNVINYAKELQRDMTLSTRNNFFVRFSNMPMFNSPFGTRVGEVRAWERLSLLSQGHVWRSGAL